MLIVAVWTGPTKRSQYSGDELIMEMQEEKWEVRWTSMLILVANAEGLATEEPLFTVVVAFSEARTEPVELTFCARENPAVSTVNVKGSFMAAELAGNGIN